MCRHHHHFRSNNHASVRAPFTSGHAGRATLGARVALESPSAADRTGFEAERAAIKALLLPATWTAVICGDQVELRGPDDIELEPSLERHASWSAADGCWRVPLANGLTFARSVRRAQTRIR